MFVFYDDPLASNAATCSLALIRSDDKLASFRISNASLSPLVTGVVSNPTLQLEFVGELGDDTGELMGGDWESAPLLGGVRMQEPRGEEPRPE